MQPVTEWRVWKEADDLGQQQHTCNRTGNILALHF